jgi:hypothetical protein
LSSKGHLAGKCASAAIAASRCNAMHQYPGTEIVPSPGIEPRIFPECTIS